MPTLSGSGLNFDLPNIKKLKIGRSVRPGAVRNQPRIQTTQRLPDINYGAVAQAGRQPRKPPNPLQAPGPAGFDFNRMPQTKLPKLSKPEQDAIKAIKQSSAGNYHDPGYKANQLIFNPTPKMQVHLNNMVGGEQAHSIAKQYAEQSPSWTQPLQKSVNITPQEQQQWEAAHPKETAQLQMPPTKESGFGVLPIPSGAADWANRLGTGVSSMAIGAGPGLIELGVHGYKESTRAGEQLNNALTGRHQQLTYPSQEPYFKALGKQTAHSFMQTLTNPRQVIDDPAQFFANALTVASAGAGAAARVGEIGDIAASLKAGEIGQAEAIQRVGKTLMRPQPQTRNITLGGPPQKHFNAEGFDSAGIHKSQFAGKPGEAKYDLLRMPVVADYTKPEKSLIGPRGASHDVFGDVPRSKQASAIINPDTGQVESVNLHSHNLDVRPAKAKQVKQAIMDVANEKLAEANHTPYRVPAPAFKGAFGGYMQSKVLDPLTEKVIASSKLKRAGVAGKNVGREFKMPNTIEGLSPSGHVGKLIRRDFEMQANMSRGLEEQKILQHMAPGSPSSIRATRMLGHLDVWDKADAGAGTTGLGQLDPKFLKDHPWAQAVPIAHMPDGEIRVGFPGMAHEDSVMPEDMQKHGIDPYRGEPWKEMEKKGYMEGTGIVDPETGKVVKVNVGNEFKGTPGYGTDNRTGGPKSLEKDMLAAANHVLHGDPLPAEGRGALAGMKPSEAQKLAFGRGTAKAHLRLWHSLYHGAPGAADAGFHDNPEAFVGIKRPPTGPVKAKLYSNEQGVARQWRSMVETDPKKLLADPGAYSFIPRGMWQKMKLHEPEIGVAANVINAIDRGTQMIRIGRFLHPGYAAWAVQNGVLHLSQAGMFGFRNAYQLRHEFPRLTPEEKAVFDNASGAGHFGGGIARATEGSGKFAGVSAKLADFWHKVDDRYWRRMSFIHELNHEGYHNAEDWANLMRTNNPEFRRIAMKGQQQAIHYGEMSPAERATLQKLFTAWGWTRGASTFTMRFPFEHPAQAAAVEQLGRRGEKDVKQFYAGHNGMAPDWLRGDLPLGKGNSPTLLTGGLFNPGETFGNLISEIPGATKGQTSSLAQEEAPVPMALQELMTGMDRYGKALKGNQRVTQPITDLAHRFVPFSTFQNLTSSKKGGGTFTQGTVPGLEQFFSAPLTQLRDAKSTAALGMKDYEQALAKPDEINFRYHLSIQRLPKEFALYRQQAGSNVPPAFLSKIKGDLEAVHQRDMFQYQFATQHGAKSYRSLPAINKVHGAIQFMTQHKYISMSEANSILQTASTMKDDSQLESLASTLWTDTGIGAVSTEWQNTIKDLQPKTLTPARG